MSAKLAVKLKSPHFAAAFDMQKEKRSPARGGAGITFLRFLNSLIMFYLPQTEIMLKALILSITLSADFAERTACVIKLFFIKDA